MPPHFENSSSKVSHLDNQRFSTEQSENKLAQILFGVTAFLFFIFIVFVSWLPIGLNKQANPESFEVLSHFPSIKEVCQFHELRDVTLNVLLYLPLGVFTALAALSGRRAWWALWIFLGALVSFGMEAGQVLIGRYADPVDIMTNSFGYLLGFALIGITVRVFHLKPGIFFGISSDESKDWNAQVFGAIRFIYGGVFMIVALLRFDIVISAAGIYSKLQPGPDGVPEIILDPLFHFAHWARDGQKLFFEFLGLLPIAILTALKNRQKRYSDWVSPVLACVVLAVLAELAQLFITDRTSDVILLPIAVIAGVLGYWMVRLGLPPIQSEGENGVRGQGESSNFMHLKVAFLGVIFSIFFIAVFSWVPFQFEYDFQAILHKLRQGSNWLPFRYHLTDRSLEGALDLVRESGLYFPLGAFLRYGFQARSDHFSKTKGMGNVILLAMSLATLMEFSQLMCRGRYLDVTDLFLAGAGAMAGAFTSKLFFSREQNR